MFIKKLWDSQKVQEEKLQNIRKNVFCIKYDPASPKSVSLHELLDIMRPNHHTVLLLT